MKVLLELSRLCAGYDGSQILFDLDLLVAEGSFVTLLGRNGMGKTTTVRCIVRQIPLAAGRILFAGKDVSRWESHRLAREGIGLVPEGRQVFPDLTVEEHLRAFAANRAGSPRPWTVADLFSLFPSLYARRRHLGRELSGGEQQMLAIARALSTNPRFLILDEATEGIAPLVREKIWECLTALRQAGLTMLVIDKHLDVLLDLADRHYLIEKGRIVWHGDSPALRRERARLERHLGV